MSQVLHTPTYTLIKQGIMYLSVGKGNIYIKIYMLLAYIQDIHSYIFIMHFKRRREERNAFTHYRITSINVMLPAIIVPSYL